MSELIFFIVSALPAFLIGLFIYKNDKEKEPTKLLVTLGLCGILSVILTLIISTIIRSIFPTLMSDYATLNPIQLIFYAFIGVALVEEFSKWIFVYKITYNSKEFDHMYDMIVYAVFVSLGFAFLENLLYVYSNGLANGLMRAITAVPAHASFGVLMGYFLGLTKITSINGKKNLTKKYFALSIVVPMLLHGLYDYCLMINNYLFLIVYFFLVIGMFIYVIKRIKRVSNISLKFRYKYKYCPTCGTEVTSNFCPKCGRKHS